MSEVVPYVGRRRVPPITELIDAGSRLPMVLHSDRDGDLVGPDRNNPVNPIYAYSSVVLVEDSPFFESNENYLFNLSIEPFRDDLLTLKEARLLLRLGEGHAREIMAIAEGIERHGHKSSSFYIGSWVQFDPHGDGSRLVKDDKKYFVHPMIGFHLKGKDYERNRWSDISGLIDSVNEERDSGK